MTEKKKAGRPRVHANDAAKVAASRMITRQSKLEAMEQDQQRKFADRLWKQHAKDIIATFAECREFTKDKKPVVYEDKLLQFNLNTDRAIAFLKITLGGKMCPTKIVRELDFLRSQYYRGMNIES